MARRMIDDSMWSNEQFAEMPLGARLLQIGIINHADDQGRVKANPAYLRAQIFPYDDIDAATVQVWLELIAENDTIILYQVNGKQYIQLINWWRYQSLQYAQPSMYPRPEGWKDRIRRTLTKGVIVTCNWQRVNGEPIEDTCDMDGNAIGSVATGGRRSETRRNGDDNSPKQSGEYTGEQSGEDTTKLNITKLNENITTTTIGESDQVNEDLPYGGGGVLLLWEEEIDGKITPSVKADIKSLITRYGIEEVTEAIRLAALADKRTPRYVGGILKKRAKDATAPPVPVKPNATLAGINLGAI